MSESRAKSQQGQKKAAGRREPKRGARLQTAAASGLPKLFTFDVWIVLGIGAWLQWYSSIQLGVAKDEYGYTVGDENPWILGFGLAPSLVSLWLMVWHSIGHKRRWSYEALFKRGYGALGYASVVNFVAMLIALVPYGDGIGTIRTASGWHYWYDGDMGPVWTSAIPLYLLATIFMSGIAVLAYAVLVAPFRLYWALDSVSERARRKEERREAERLVAEAKAQAQALEADAKQVFPALPSRRQPLATLPTLPPPGSSPAEAQPAADASQAASPAAKAGKPAAAASKAGKPALPTPPAPKAVPLPVPPTPKATPPSAPAAPPAPKLEQIDDGDLDRFRPPKR